MLRINVALGVAALGLALAPPASADLRVFACEPEWAALAREIGGERVNVYSATHARQDPHHIRARPSLIAKARRADLLICSGAGLEVGWLPILLRRGASARILPGSTGHLMASRFVALLETPARVDRSMGDIHPEGNPHVHLDPRNITVVARELARRMQRADTANAGDYGANLKTFETRWNEAAAGWDERARRLAGMPVIVHHRSWSYLIRWIGLKQIATLEPKPGIPPTPTHLQGVLRLARNSGVTAILRTPYEPKDASLWLSEKTGIPAIVLPYTVGGDDRAKDLFALFTRSLGLLEEAHGKR
jgi:zinc/manganese transport system substrate-binding protein